MTHKHHVVPVSRGGCNDSWNFVSLDPYTHAYEHALDFVLFEHSPTFDFRHEAWPLLPEGLREAVLVETSKRMSKREVSEATKKKQSESLTGRQLSAETKVKLSEINLGRILDAQTREKMSRSHTGKTLSEPHCLAISSGLVGHSVSQKNRDTARKTCQENFGKTNTEKFQCLVTGKVSTAGPLTGYQKARGIDPSLRERVYE